MRLIFAGHLVAAIVAGGAFDALAQSTCIPKEYAQYKDLARTRDGRHDLAIDYCLADLRSKNWQSGSRQQDQCEAEKSKIVQVLELHKEAAALRYAEAGCKGKHPLGGK